MFNIKAKSELLVKCLKEIPDVTVNLQEVWNKGLIEKHTIILTFNSNGSKYRILRDTCICVSPFPEDLFLEMLEYLKNDLVRQIEEQKGIK